jgi:hypothetical protein
VPGGDGFRADLLRYRKQLIELQMIVAEAAWNRRASGQILLHEGTNHIALETVFVVDHVIRNANGLGYATGIINIVNRTAAALYGLRHALVASQSALVPELHGQADNVVAFGAQHGRNG